MPPRKAFISYSHKDKVWLDRLVEHLGVSAEEVALDYGDDRGSPSVTSGSWR